MHVIQQKSAEVVETPAESPDLNPIKNVWGSMKYYLRNHYKPTNLRPSKKEANRTVHPCETPGSLERTVLRKEAEGDGGSRRICTGPQAVLAVKMVCLWARRCLLQLHPQALLTLHPLIILVREGAWSLPSKIKSYKIIG